MKKSIILLICMLVFISSQIFPAYAFPFGNQEDNNFDFTSNADDVISEEQSDVTDENVTGDLGAFTSSDEMEEGEFLPDELEDVESEELESSPNDEESEESSSKDEESKESSSKDEKSGSSTGSKKNKNNSEKSASDKPIKSNKSKSDSDNSSGDGLIILLGSVSLVAVLVLAGALWAISLKNKALLKKLEEIDAEIIKIKNKSSKIFENTYIDNGELDPNLEELKRVINELESKVSTLKNDVNKQI